MSLKDKVVDKSNINVFHTDMLNGVSGIKVTLDDCIENPYKNMVNITLATWGSKIHKWDDLNSEERFYIVSKILNRKALPISRESIEFIFSIDGVSRSSFDQIARQRIGSAFSSIGSAANQFNENAFRIPNEIVDSGKNNVDLLKACINDCKSTYVKLIENGISWQSARSVLPMGLEHLFYAIFSYEAFASFCGKRLCFEEQEDTVAAAWLMRNEVNKKFPLLASYLRPSCDWVGKCTYITGEQLAEEMGGMFTSCNRNRCLVDYKPEFNKPSTKMYHLENQLNIIIPKANDDIPPKNYAQLHDLDKRLFNDSQYK